MKNDQFQLATPYTDEEGEERVRFNAFDEGIVRDLIRAEKMARSTRIRDLGTGGAYSRIKRQQEAPAQQDALLEQKRLQTVLQENAEAIKLVQQGIKNTADVASDVFKTSLGEQFDSIRNREDNDAMLQRAALTAIYRAAGSGAGYTAKDDAEIEEEARMLLKSLANKNTNSPNDLISELWGLSAENSNADVARIAEKAMALAPDSQSAASGLLATLKTDMDRVMETGDVPEDQAMLAVINEKVGNPNVLDAQQQNKLAAIGSAMMSNPGLFLQRTTENPSLLESINIGGMGPAMSASIIRSGSIANGDFEGAKEFSYEFAGANDGNASSQRQLSYLQNIQAQTLRMLAENTVTSRRPNIARLRGEVEKMPAFQVLPDNLTFDQKMRTMSVLLRNKNAVTAGYFKGLVDDIRRTDGAVLDPAIRQNIADRTGMSKEQQDKFLRSENVVGQPGKFGSFSMVAGEPTPEQVVSAAADEPAQPEQTTDTGDDEPVPDDAGSGTVGVNEEARKIARSTRGLSSGVEVAKVPKVIPDKQSGAVLRMLAGETTPKLKDAATSRHFHKRPQGRRNE